MFTWVSAYSVGVEEIDNQHKKILDFLNQLVNLSSAEASPEVIKKVLLEFERYTHSHFATENRLMAKYQYPVLREHSKEHEEMALKIKEIINNYNCTEIDITTDILVYMKKWITKHLTSIDQNLYNYLKIINAVELNISE